MEDKALNEFILKAKKNYFLEDASKTTDTDKHTIDFKYSEGIYEYRVHFDGLESFTGQEAVFENNVPVWSMNHVGEILDLSLYNAEFLKEALSHHSFEEAYRGKGPETYKKGDYEYISTYSGYLDLFRGKEEIKYKDKLVYRCYYHGCLLK